MSETVLDSVSIGAGASTTAVCGKPAESPNLVVEVTGFDSNSTDLAFAASGGSAFDGDNVRPLTHSGSAPSGVDASGTGATVVLDGLEGLSWVELQVTNNAASSTTITVEEDTDT